MDMLPWICIMDTHHLPLPTDLRSDYLSKVKAPVIRSIVRVTMPNVMVVVIAIVANAMAVIRVAVWKSAEGKDALATKIVVVVVVVMITGVAEVTVNHGCIGIFSTSRELNNMLCSQLFQ